MKKIVWPAISKKELFWVLVLAVSASLLSLMPTIWSYLKTPTGSWFAGFSFIHDPWDVNVYLNAIRQGFNGHWLYQNPYDPTSAPLPIYFLYLFLGHLARILSLPIPLAYHLGNLLLTIFFFLVLYLFLAFFFEEKNWRLTTLFLVAFGGGVGWLALPRNIYLADTSFPDSTVFQTLHLPQFVLNQTFFLATLLSSFLALSFKKWRLAFLSGLSGVFLSLTHPYSLAVVIFILSGYFLLFCLTRKNLPGIIYLVLPFFLWAGALLFFYFLLRQNVLLAQIGPSPPPFYLFLSYGFLTPLAIWGAISFWQKRDEKNLFLLSWLIFHFLFLYLPFISFQRLTIKGFFIIFGIAAARGLKNLGELMKKPQLIYFLILFFSISTHIIINIHLISLLFLPEPNRWIYLTQEEKQTFDFLLENSKEGEIVLASYRIGNFLPANTANRVYFGHDVSIFNPQEKRENITRFYSEEPLFSRRQFLKKEKIDYVFWGPEEKEEGDLDLTREPYLENIYQNGKVTLFKVR